LQFIVAEHNFLIAWLAINGQLAGRTAVVDGFLGNVK